MMKVLSFLLPIVGAVFGLTACGDDPQSVYSNSRASFYFTPTTEAPPLQAALNGYGEFCDIKYDNKKYYFSGINSSYTYTRLAVDIRNATVSLSNGFIVGRGSLADLGSDAQPILCYDHVCPNCFRESYISRILNLREGGFAQCSRCTRFYDLNNQGVVSSDTIGIKLERYRVAYGNNTLVISN